MQYAAREANDVTEGWARVRVSIADDHQVFRVGLRAVLEAEPELEVVGEAASAPAALTLVTVQKPDVAILDMRMGDDSGLSIIPELLVRSPKTRVLILSMHEEPEIVRQALSSGVHGYVNKAADPSEIVRGVNALAQGRSFLSVRLEPAGLGQAALPRESARFDYRRSESPSPSSARPSASAELSKVCSRTEQRASTSPSARPLSEREREILDLFARGLTQRQIADALGVRLKTIETYRCRLGDKFAVRSRAELVRQARELGLVRGEGEAQSLEPGQRSAGLGREPG
jgi:DNA-binding NarL/FixJ family response regulator